MKIAIAGLGYTGKAIYQGLKYLHQENNSLFLFSRNTKIDDSQLLDFAGEFQSISSDSWNAFFRTKYDKLLLTFSIHDLNQKTILKILRNAGQCFLFSSTGIFKRINLENELIIDELTPKDENHKRYLNEKFWLENGGKIIYLSGIYGPERNPIDWIINGKVKKNYRQLNLIHLNDIKNFTINILIGQNYIPAEMILSDGQIHTWNDIFNVAAEEGWIKKFDLVRSSKENAICNSSLVQNFFPHLQFANFWHELKILNQNK